MEITNIKIKNFRSLRDFESPLKKFTVIIGENDVGKTTILYAIDKFFANKKITDDSDFFNKNTKVPISIELTFKGLEEFKEFEEYQNQEKILKFEREFEHKKESQTYIYDENNKKVKISKTKANSILKQEWFHFVPVNRSLNDQFSMKKTALLGKTFRALMKIKLNDSELQETQEKINYALESAIEPAREKLELLIQEQLNNDKINLNFPNLKIDPVEGVHFDVTTNDDKIEDIPMDQRGAGTQNSLILALYRFIATNASSDFILALEEPENSFHPQGQRELLSALHKLSDKAQVICTTHSPVFVDRVDFRSNLIIVRNVDGSSTSKTLDDSKFSDVRSILGIRPSDALLKGGGNCAIIAEGKSEEYAFPNFMKLCGLNGRQLGVTVVPIGGNDLNTIRNYITLLDAYSLPFCVVLDGDLSDLDREELERIYDIGTYATFRHLHIYQKGCLEDYYPIELFKRAILKEFPEQIEETEVKTFSELKCKKRLKEITKHFREKGKTFNPEFFKKVFAENITDWMIEEDYPLDDELKDLFKKVEEIALTPNLLRGTTSGTIESL